MRSECWVHHLLCFLQNLFNVCEFLYRCAYSVVKQNKLYRIADQLSSVCFIRKKNDISTVLFLVVFPFFYKFVTQKTQINKLAKIYYFWWRCSVWKIRIFYMILSVFTYLPLIIIGTSLVYSVWIFALTLFIILSRHFCGQESCPNPPL